MVLYWSSNNDMMRKTTSIITRLAAALAFAAIFTSCSDLRDKQKEYVYVFDIDNEETKATVGRTCVEWTNSDQVGFITGSHYGYAYVDADNDPCSIIFYSSSKISAGDYVYSYFPYEQSTASATAAAIRLDPVQYGAGVSAMPLAALPLQVSSDINAKTSSNGELNYVNLGSIVSFYVYSTDSGQQSEAVKSIVLQAEVPIAGTGSLDLTRVSDKDESTLKVENYTSTSVKVYQTEVVARDAESAPSIKMILAPVTTAFELTVNTDKNSYTFAVPSKTFARSAENVININLANAGSTEEAEDAESLDYSEPFTSSKGLFTIEDVTTNSALEEIWSFNSSYGMVASGEYNSVKYATESWLVSPLLDLVNVDGAVLTFDHTFRYGNKTSLTLWGRVEGGEWSQITIPTYPTGSDWKYVSSGSISLASYVGHNMQFAFKYVSTTSSAAKWEIKNVLVKETFDSGDDPGDNPGDNPGNTTTSSVPVWFEMPVVNDSDKNRIDDKDKTLYYAYHWCAGGEKAPSGSKARNYAVCFSSEHHCPVWIAAPRHSMYVGSAGRNDSYRQDPDIPSGIQYSSKSTGGGCNKGHMLGSAERTCSVATNKQVFYYTNIAPQLGTGFNTGGGGWNILEDYIDGLVPADTLYEVIGCYFDDYTDGYGKSQTAQTIAFGGRTDVHMPTMFYYALLRTKSGNSKKAVTACTADELQCVAFVRAHSNSLKGQKPSSKEMMSISDLEKITGFTYFPNVPNAPKDSFKASDWGL